MSAINSEIFNKSFVTTPEIISDIVLDFCASINPDNLPFNVAVTPDESSLISGCFDNVLSKVERDGGSILYGWSIWEWPDVFIEAEHHAVWALNGKIYDVTPHANNEKEIVFLPDPTQIYDYEFDKRIKNIRQCLGKVKAVSPWIAASNDYDDAVEQYSYGKEIHVNSKLINLEHAKRNGLGYVFLELAANKRVNDKCFCTSGKKFKKCCGPLIVK